MRHAEEFWLLAQVMFDKTKFDARHEVQTDSQKPDGLRRKSHGSIYDESDMQLVHELVHEFGNLNLAGAR